MARVWTCAGCKARWPRTKQRCSCGRKRPASKRPSHLKALELPYERYVELNGGEVCGICGNPPKDGRRLHRDHDHRTGEPRGLLCFQCNRGLPNYATAEWIRAAAAYLGADLSRPREGGVADPADEDAHAA